ncbi:phage baseplate assembly protein V [Endozoicomonas lisbonensis]|uniref:Uncharacterized protein involved in type VI secretion and phage assembly n=1 Tax=Endozoicomonas lisbonensis TaxID=3120522 RepID=A0ABV2SC18_9GAMM
MSAVSVKVTAGGKELTPKLRVVSVEAHWQCHDIPRATLVVADGETTTGKWENSELPQLAPGKEVDIKASFLGDKASEVTLFKGLITGQSLKASTGGSFLTLQLHGDLIKLVEPRLSQVFPEKSKDGDIIKKLITDGGATAKAVAATTVEHTQLAVYDESPWSFIKYLAEANGLLVMPGLEGVTIDAPAKLKGKDHKLRIDQFKTVSLDLDDTNALEKVSASAWSVKDQKAESPAKGAAPTNIAGGKETAASAAKALGRKEWATVSGSLLQAGELTGWSTAELVYRELDRYRGSLSVEGMEAAPGDSIELEDFGALFNGKYMVTGVNHRVDGDGWTTTLSIGLPLTRTRFFNGLHKQAPRVRGLLIGQVQAYKDDPDAQFRFPVLVPAFGAKDNILWARLGAPYASAEAGLFLPPKPNDEVVLGWCDDDPRQPVILGSLHNPRNKPPLEFDNKLEKRGLVITKDALTWLFDEKEKNLTLTASDKVSTVLSETDGQLLSQDKNTVTLNKEVIVESDKDVTLKPGGKAVLKAGADVAVEASGNCAIKAAKTEIQ